MIHIRGDDRVKQKRRLRTAACVLLAGTVLAAFVALAADAGS